MPLNSKMWDAGRGPVKKRPTQAQRGAAVLFALLKSEPYKGPGFSIDTAPSTLRAAPSSRRRAPRRPVGSIASSAPHAAFLEQLGILLEFCGGELHGPATLADGLQHALAVRPQLRGGILQSEAALLDGLQHQGPIAAQRRRCPGQGVTVLLHPFEGDVPVTDQLLGVLDGLWSLHLRLRHHHGGRRRGGRRWRRRRGGQLEVGELFIIVVLLHLHLCGSTHLLVLRLLRDRPAREVDAGGGGRHGHGRAGLAMRGAGCRRRL
mmetsp:Transcript_59766/g.195115  ORF Transcript_59766/g.195115 Transcript_59766/m.195115 type:complete len:263 (-) Transcript_59766:210-998(-)